MKLFTRLSVFVTVVTLSSGASRATFGESCNKSERCDSRNFLSCSSSSVCECLMPDSMVYDEIAGKCVTLAGERCLFTTVEGETNLLVQLPCISNGNCNDGVCECFSSHFELSNGTCSEKMGFGGMCTSNMMCDSTDYLTCGPDKTCICDPSRGLVREESECKILPGSICVRNQGAACTLGSWCNSTTSTCECASDRFQSVNGSCIHKGSRGDSCSSNTECLDMVAHKPTFLICEEGKCVCNSTVSIADKSGSCRKQLGLPCSYNNCIEGANCIERVCQCVRSTHFPTENQTCEQRRIYGESCATDEQCISNLRCDSFNKCNCFHRYSYNIVSNKCVASVGSICEGSDADCVPNAYCDVPEFSGWGDSRINCKCQSNFKSSRNRDGYCYATQSFATCNGDNFGPLSSKQCLPGLVCRDGNCDCLYRDHQSYDDVSETCKSAIGGPCNDTSDCNDVGAECYEDNENGIRQCQCKEGYNQVGRECRVSNGGNCDVSKSTGPETCDKIAGLECTSKGICECPALQEYDAEEITCKRLIGAKCSVNIRKDQPCGPLSFCKLFRGSDDGFGICTCSPPYTASPDRHCTLGKVKSSTTMGTTIRSYVRKYHIEN